MDERFKGCISKFHTEQSGIRVALIIDWVNKKYKLDRSVYKSIEEIQKELKADTGIEMSKEAIIGMVLEMGAIVFNHKTTNKTVCGLKEK